MERRFQDLQEHPKQMINNILGSHPKKIVTTRIVTRSADDDITIVTDPHTSRNPIIQLCQMLHELDIN